MTSTNRPLPGGEELSGNCKNLALVECSIVRNSSVEIENINFPSATNFYLAVWSRDRKELKSIGLAITKACVDCKEPPVIACEDQVNVSLGAEGTGDVCPDLLLAGDAIDFCTSTENLIYRLAVPPSIGASKPPRGAQECVTVDCDDVGTTIQMQVWVGDEDNQWSSCIVDVRVEDKLSFLQERV